MLRELQLLVPIPQEIESTTEMFEIHQSMNVQASKNILEKINQIIDSFNKLQTILKLDINDLEPSNLKNIIFMTIDSDLFEQAESYLLKIHKSRINLIGSDFNGIFYGLMTLKQLITIFKKKE